MIKLFNMGKNNIRKTTEQFITESKKIFGDKYDYSKTEYVNSKTKVCITCPEHGDFLINPQSHLRGTEGCKKCCKDKIGRNIFKTKNDFIEESKKIHGDKYDYSKVEYKNSETKVCIICPKHGEFWQIPNNHLKGKGCPDCYGNRKLTKEKFIEKSKTIHGEKYDYSKVEYKNVDTKVCIICPKHGEFWQTPYKHIRNRQGCSKCRGKVTTLEEFIEESKKVHGDVYDYSKVEFINSTKKVCIICPKHGEFWQTPTHHISGEGCPKCKMSFLEKTVKNVLDNFNIEYKTEVGNKTLNWIGKLRLDFYIPDLNIGIEVQGQQHYIPVNIFGGIDALQKNIKRDELKKKLCEKNGLKLYYIKYNDNIINETLKILKENGLQI